MLEDQEHGVMSAAKTSVVSAAKTSALSAAKTSALSAAAASALKTSASSHISMLKTQMAITRLIWLARISFRGASAQNFAAVLFGFHKIHNFFGMGMVLVSFRSRIWGPESGDLNLGT